MHEGRLILRLVAPLNLRARLAGIWVKVSYRFQSGLNVQPLPSGEPPFRFENYDFRTFLVELLGVSETFFDSIIFI